jgi:signal transduction histidine kinase
MNRSGIVFTRPRDTISFFVGFFLFIVGLIPLLLYFKLVDWALPSFLQSLSFQIAIWVIAVAGLYIVIDGFIEPPAHNLHWILIVAGLVLFTVGLLPILHNFGVIGLDLGRFLKELFIYQAIITIEGILLIIGGLTEH